LQIQQRAAKWATGAKKAPQFFDLAPGREEKVSRPTWSFPARKSQRQRNITDVAPDPGGHPFAINVRRAGGRIFYVKTDSSALRLLLAPDEFSRAISRRSTPNRIHRARHIRIHRARH
jgi:hypothetical protein